MQEPIDIYEIDAFAWSCMSDEQRTEAFTALAAVAQQLFESAKE